MSRVWFVERTSTPDENDHAGHEIRERVGCVREGDAPEREPADPSATIFTTLPRTFAHDARARPSRPPPRKRSGHVSV